MHFPTHDNTDTDKKKLVHLHSLAPFGWDLHSITLSCMRYLRPVISFSLLRSNDWSVDLSEERQNVGYERNRNGATEVM